MTTVAWIEGFVILIGLVYLAAKAFWKWHRVPSAAQLVMQDVLDDIELGTMLYDENTAALAPMKQWRRGVTARDRSIGIGFDCDGSPKCTAEITIERNSSLASEEIHLTVDEVRWAMARLAQALIAEQRRRSRQDRAQRQMEQH